MGHETRSIRRLVPVGSVGAGPATAGGGTGRPLASLEPRGVGAILDTALDVLRARMWICLALSIPLWVPVQVLGQRVPQNEFGSDALLLMMVHVGLTVGVQSVVVGLICQVVYAELQGRVVSLGSVLMTVLRRAVSLTLLTVSTAVATGLGAACCVVPGIVAAWLLMVAPASLVLEELGAFAAISRSARLMSKSFWRWLGVMVTQTMLLLPLTIVSATLSDPSARAVVEKFLGWPAGVYGVLVLVVSSALLGLVTAFSAIVMTVFYLDGRVRHEGFDLHMRFERIRSRGGAAR